MAQKKSGGFGWILFLLVIGFLIYKFAPREPTTIAYAEEFKGALEQFQKDQVKAEDALKQAFKAYDEAKDVLFKYSDPKTQEFIKRWHKAKERAERLKADFRDVLTKADKLFKELYKRANEISDPKLREKMLGLIKERERRFYTKAEEVARSLQRLDQIIRKGDDIVKAIEIAGALNISETELDRVQGEIDTTFRNLKLLVQEGEGILGNLLGENQ